MYSKNGRPSIAPEKLLRSVLLQVLYTIRSERQLMEQLDYNLLYRWFVGQEMDDAVWDVTVFTKNRERLLKSQIAQAFFDQVLKQARGEQLLRRSFHGGWDVDRGLGWAEKLPAPGRQRQASAGRWQQSDGGFPWRGAP